MFGGVVAGGDCPAAVIAAPRLPGVVWLVVASDMAVGAPHCQHGTGDGLGVEVSLVHFQVYADGSAIVLADGMDLLRRGAADIFREGLRGKDIQAQRPAC